MTLYLKAAQDGVSVGDCPFSHFVRLVLEEKGLDYELKPTAPDAKPKWLLEHYDGKMPALRHDRECYVESSVIADYLEFFFPTPSLAPQHPESQQVLDGFFPAVAQYLKTTEDQDTEQLETLRERLIQLNEHLVSRTFVDGDSFSLLDCRLVPQLYHLQTGIHGFKTGVPHLDLQQEYPHVPAYLERCMARPSFQATVYPPETILWGWGNARNHQN